MEQECDWLKRWNMYAPNEVALVDGETDRHWTYAELFSLSVRYAAALHDKFEISRGDRIVAMLANSLEYVALFFAIQRLGGILVPVNTRNTARELEHIILDSKPQCVVIGNEFSEVKAGLSQASKILCHLESDWFSILSAGVALTEDWVGNFEDPVMILYTSGTTGAPKGAVLTHKTLFWNSINTSLRLNLVSNDCAVIFLPLFHTGGWNVLLTPLLHRGGKAVLLKKFDAPMVLSAGEKYGATLLFGVPTTMARLAETSEFAQTDFSKIRFAIVGGEPMPLALMDIWENRGVPIRQGYGLTEFGPNVFSLSEKDSRRKKGSIGFPNFYIETRIVNQAGDECVTDEVGELWLRGPAAMAEYWNQNQATRDVFCNGWLKTGDLVSRDGDGFFYVVGRKKEMYISGGENVYPIEVEQVIHQIPGVSEVAVIGVPDSKWGETGRAYVVPQNGRVITVEEILKHCENNLARFKVPKEVYIRTDLPKSESGKILKRNLTN